MGRKDKYRSERQNDNDWYWILYGIWEYRGTGTRNDEFWTSSCYGFDRHSVDMAGGKRKKVKALKENQIYADIMCIKYSETKYEKTYNKKSTKFCYI